MNKILIILLCLPVLLTTCKKEENSIINSFSGNWEGTYSGSESGIWVGSVTSDGDFINGIITSNSNDIYFATGTVSSSGTFELTAGTVTTGAIFSGNATGNIVNGSWQNSSEGMSGNWSGNLK